MMGNGLGKCSSIFGALIFIFKGIPGLCMLADILVRLFLAFNTLLYFQNGNIFFFYHKTKTCSFLVMQKNITRKSQNTTNLIFQSYPPSSFSVHLCLHT